jgi:hypothetical protein
MTSAELKGLIKDAEYLEHRDVVFAHILIGMVVALENIREEMIVNEAARHWRWREDSDGV